MRATICVDVNRDDECAAAEAWLDRWRTQLAVVSENEGCGCCVNIWNVDGPAEAILEIPEALRADSEWTRAAENRSRD
jgi:hypothetical protein